MRKWPYNTEKTYYHARVVTVKIETNPDASKRSESLAPKEIELSAVKRLMNMVNALKAENKELQIANEELEKKNKRLRLDRLGSNIIVFGKRFSNISYVTLPTKYTPYYTLQYKSFCIQYLR